MRSLESLFEMRYPNFNVVVMDQASEDGTIEKIKEWAQGKIPVEGKYIDYKSSTKPAPYTEYAEDELASAQPVPEQPFAGRLTIVKNKVNHPYYQARSLGIDFILRVYKPDWVLPVDNDTIVPADLLDRLLNITRKEPDAGILGPKFIDYNTGQIWQEGGTYNRWTGVIHQGHSAMRARAKGKEYIEVDFVTTACMLCSRKLLETVPVWRDNTARELAVHMGLTARSQGFEILYSPEIIVWNDRTRKNQSQESIRQAEDRWTYMLVRDELYLIGKHSSKLQYPMAMTSFVLRQVPAGIRFLFFSRRWYRAGLHIKGILDYWKERGNRPGSV